MDKEEFINSFFEYVKVTYPYKYKHDIRYSGVDDLLNEFIIKNKITLHKPMSDEDYESDRFA